MLRYIVCCVVCLSNVQILAGNIDFSRIHHLNNENKTYSYPINFSFGVLLNNLPIFVSQGSFSKSSDFVLKDVWALGAEIKFSCVMTNIFSAKTFGFFPKTGILIQGFSMNYGRALITSCRKFVVYCFKGSPKWEFMPRNTNFTINILWVNEPETNIFKKNRIIPQLGIGCSLINLHHDFDSDSKNRIIPLLDLCLLHRLLYIKKTSFCDIEFNCGYTYNPLLGLIFSGDHVRKNLVGGIINFFVGVSLSFYNNLGLESVEWFDEDWKKIDFYKKLCLMDIFYVLGKWYDFTDMNTPKSNLYNNILVSLSYPYLSKITDSFFYGLGVDISEDIRDSVSKKDASFLSLILNNFNLIFNFAQFSWAYKNIRISNSFGCYILTNLYNTFVGNDIAFDFGRREIANEVSNFRSNYSIKWFDYLTGRATYRPRIYINVFKMFRKREKFNFLDKFVFVVGINTILFNHRNDYCLKHKNLKEFSNIELLKIESFIIGISINI